MPWHIRLYNCWLLTCQLWRGEKKSLAWFMQCFNLWKLSTVREINTFLKKQTSERLIAENWWKRERLQARLEIRIANKENSSPQLCQEAFKASSKHRPDDEQWLRLLWISINDNARPRQESLTTSPPLRSCFYNDSFSWITDNPEINNSLTHLWLWSPNSKDFSLLTFRGSTVKLFSLHAQDLTNKFLSYF